MNSYASVDEFRGTYVLNVNATGSANVQRFRELLEGVSREVDKITKRHFYSVSDTRYFDGPGNGTLFVGDVVSIPASGLKESDNMDGTFDVVWGNAGTDYFYAPYNANPTSTFGDARPYMRLEISQHSNGTQDSFDKGQRNYEITGTWGFSHATNTQAATASASFSASTTTITYAGAGPQIGWTLLNGVEQMYVESTSGTTVVLRRGVNGSTATVIASGSIFSRREYPSPVREAVLIQAGRLFRRAKGGFGQEMGLPEAGELVPMIPNGIDSDVRQMLGPFKRRYMGK